MAREGTNSEDSEAIEVIRSESVPVVQIIVTLSPSTKSAGELFVCSDSRASPSLSRRAAKGLFASGKFPTTTVIALLPLITTLCEL